MTNFWHKLPKELVINGVTLTFDWPAIHEGKHARVIGGRIVFLKPATFRYTGPDAYTWAGFKEPKMSATSDFIVGAAELTGYVNGVITHRMLEPYWEVELLRIKKRVAESELLDPVIKSRITNWIARNVWRRGNIIIKATTWADFEELCDVLDCSAGDVQVKEDRSHIRSGDFDSLVSPVKPIIIMRTPRTGKMPSTAWKIPGLVVILVIHTAKPEVSDEPNDLLP